MAPGTKPPLGGLRAVTVRQVPGTSNGRHSHGRPFLCGKTRHMREFWVVLLVCWLAQGERYEPALPARRGGRR